ncbi:hypothetical protein DSM106972_024130 [Dulcicalothrix desertica PCC 7102]|uniref:Catalase n=1 Tax=Dulcicalothrix desertica PCC 7102 TaxID=232991 RepID=A0A3S1AQW6_9CYAN|nr:catalase family protein [Dulcicalothrix desertica]RUT07152.1 hypothetical protein DSM106972_024130 [Dulcicalothrix desertica PCC 7102]TWH61852.1 Catalase [Dulcicalothrix desertica PCC 7102]
MSNQDLSYIRYSDDVEVKQPDEEKTIEDIIASFERMRRFVYDKHRHALRGAHAKGHGAVKGKLTIYDNLPTELRQGLFREPRTYDVIIRFSNAPGDIIPDAVSSFRGMAIKVIGVEGHKVLEEKASALTQDFLMINHPSFPSGDVKKYLLEQLAQEKVVTVPEEALQVVTTALRTVNAVTEKVGVELYPTSLGITKPETHILGETFFTTAALRYGDYIAKISAVPVSESLIPLIGKHIKVDNHSVLRDLIVEFFRENGAEYELRTQLCTNLERMPVEDAGIVWPEEESQYQAIAKITIPPQDAYSPARRVYADEVLSFSSWHCIPEHRPLGSIQRVRLKAYETSSRFRHEMNQQPRVEPRSIDEMPD